MLENNVGKKKLLVKSNVLKRTYIADTQKQGLVWERVKIQIAQKTLWKIGEIAHFEQFHLFTQCFPKAFFFNVLK